MLVLSRKVNEVIVIGGDIEITVVRIGQDTVRIGIDAPKSYSITRKEISYRDDKTKEVPNGIGHSTVPKGKHSKKVPHPGLAEIPSRPGS